MPTRSCSTWLPPPLLTFSLVLFLFLNEPHLEWTYCSWKMPLAFPVQAFPLSFHTKCHAPRYLHGSLLPLRVFIQMFTSVRISVATSLLKTVISTQKCTLYPFLLYLLLHLSSSIISFIIYLTIFCQLQYILH